MAENDTNPIPEPPQRQPVRRGQWQFSLGWLVMVVSVVAAVAGVMRVFQAPWYIRVAFGVYLLLLAAFTLLRFPLLVGPQQESIKRHREALAKWAEQKRQHSQANKSSPGEEVSDPD